MSSVRWLLAGLLALAAAISPLSSQVGGRRPFAPYRGAAQRCHVPRRARGASGPLPRWFHPSLGPGRRPAAGGPRSGDRGRCRAPVGGRGPQASGAASRRSPVPGRLRPVEGQPLHQRHPLPGPGRFCVAAHPGRGPSPERGPGRIPGRLGGPPLPLGSCRLPRPRGDTVGARPRPGPPPGRRTGAELHDVPRGLRRGGLVHRPRSGRPPACGHGHRGRPHGTCGPGTHPGNAGAAHQGPGHGSERHLVDGHHRRPDALAAARPAPGRGRPPGQPGRRGEYRVRGSSGAHLAGQHPLWRSAVGFCHGSAHPGGWLGPGRGALRGGLPDQ